MGKKQLKRERKGMEKKSPREKNSSDNQKTLMQEEDFKDQIMYNFKKFNLLVKQTQFTDLISVQ